MCLDVDWPPLLAWEGFVGVVSSPTTDVLVVEFVAVRFLDRMVTVDGTPFIPLIDKAGDTRGGVLTRAGSLDRAD